jgi:hypothetical protein
MSYEITELFFCHWGLQRIKCVMRLMSNVLLLTQSFLNDALFGEKEDDNAGNTYNSPKCSYFDLKC